MHPEEGRTGGYRWVPWVFVAAMTLVVAVNGGLVYFATREPVGIIVKNPYQDGLRYNRTLEEREKQIALGWQIAAAVTGASGPAGVEIRVEAKDAAGQPLQGLTGTLSLDRPVERLPPVVADLQPLGGGRFVATVTLPRPGQWELTVELANGGDRHVSSKRVQVQ